MDDIVCTVKGKLLDFLELANSLHRTNNPLLRQTTNISDDLAFLDLNINLNVDRKIGCHQRTVHRNFKATSDWQSFDVVPMENQEILTENQYPTEWSCSIVHETLVK